MKEIKIVEKGENFTTVNVGKLNEIKEYELAMGNFSIPGKVFAGHALQATGAELSFQSLAAGQDYGTRHTHKTHEELYFILKGEGIFDVDGKRFPVSEGSIVRIAPNGKRAFKNTGSSEMLVLCVQYKANSFSDDDEPLKDAIMLVTIQQGEILLHYDMIAVKSHAEPQRLLSRKGGDFEPQRS